MRCPCYLILAPGLSPYPLVFLLVDSVVEVAMAEIGIRKKEQSLCLPQLNLARNWLLGAGEWEDYEAGSEDVDSLVWMANGASGAEVCLAFWILI